MEYRRPACSMARLAPSFRCDARACWHHDLVETVALTLREITPLLDPPIDEKQLRLLVQALRIQPVEWHKHGHVGHPVARYDAATIFKLHGAISVFLRPVVTEGQKPSSLSASDSFA